MSMRSPYAGEKNDEIFMPPAAISTYLKQNFTNGLFFFATLQLPTRQLPQPSVLVLMSVP